MNLTPAMQQYYDLKEQHSDALLFFRMGDFYEMFDADAHIANKVLWIAITTRNKNSDTPTPLAGIPFHAKEKYLPLLVNAWYKVAIAEQVSDPKLKWIVKREVVRVVTPSTLSLEWEGYEWWESGNLIIWIASIDDSYWLSIIDLSNNTWKTWVFSDLDDLSWYIYKISPKEVVLEKKLFSDSWLSDVLSKKYSLNIFYYDFAGDSYKYLLNHFWSKNLSWFGLEWSDEAILSSALLLDYLVSNQKSDLWFLDTIWLIDNTHYLWLDESTIRNLDLVYNFSTKSSTVWTLLWLLNKTKTPMWSRFTRNAILEPLLDLWEIEMRHKLISELAKNKPLLDEIRDDLSQVGDIDAILNRLAVNRASPRDLLWLKRSLQAIMNVADTLAEKWTAVLQKIFTQTR